MSTAVAPQPAQKKELTIRERLNNPNMIAELGRAMPAHCKPERMARVALTALTRTPKLAECDQASFFRCLLDLSQWGLEPDGRRAHLIPFENRKRGVTECQLIIDYKGYVELAYRGGFVKSIHAELVRDGDIFDYNLGDVVRHVPHFLRRDADKPATAGNVFAVYCRVQMTGGAVKTEVLSSDEVESIRKRSKAANNGPWVSDWGEMAKKTAFRRCSKWLPLSAEVADAMEKDYDVIDHAKPAAVLQTVEELGAMLGAMPDKQISHEAETAESQVPPANSSIARVRADYAAATTTAEVEIVYDRAVGPDSSAEWTAEEVAEIERLRAERKAEIRAARTFGGKGSDK